LERKDRELVEMKVEVARLRAQVAELERQRRTTACDAQ